MALTRNYKSIVTLRLAMMFGVFALFTAHGENLTTLDGKTFTNIIFVTNYPTVVVIKYDGGEAGVKAANLPEEFRAKYGIKIPTNTITASRQQTNSADLFFADHSNSELTVESETNEFTRGIFENWTIKVTVS